MDAVDKLLAIEEIRRVEARYARFADAKDWGAVGSLFAENGTFAPQDGDGKTIMILTGPQAIAEGLGATTGEDVQPLHTLFTAEIDILDETQATNIQAMADLVFRGPKAAPIEGLPDFSEMRGWGHYHSTYEKQDGVWLITERIQTRTRMTFH
jgi:hypothetical protein